MTGVIGAVLAQQHVWRFAGSEAEGYLEGTYDLRLVALSILVAVMGSYVTLAVIGLLEQLPVRRRSASRIWRGVGGVTFALAVWAMHFTGMLAFTLPTPVGFTVFPTVLSAFPVFFAAVVTITVLTAPSRGRVVFGGVILALGIGSMHYIGMEAMRVDAIMAYDARLFTLSIVVAWILATSAIVARTVVRHLVRSRIAADGVAAMLMGFAVSGMHYTAMRAVHFLPPATSGGPTVEGLDNSWLALGIAGAVLIMLVATLACIALDRRLGSAQAMAERSESRHRVLLDVMPDGFMTIEPTGTIESMNPAAELLFGYVPGELIGRQVGVVLPDLDDPTRTQLVEFSDSVHSHDLDGLRADGATLTLSVRFAKAVIGSKTLTSLVVRDVANLRAADREVRRLATAVDQVHEAILVLTEDGRVEYLNSAFIEMTGYQQDEILGRVPDLFDPAVGDEEQAADLWNTIRAGGVWVGRSINRRCDGTQYQAESRVSPIRGNQGKITSFIEVRRDLTNHNAMEQELASARKLEAIGNLAAGIAHEINTPTQYVGDNTRFLRDSFRELLVLANIVRAHNDMVKAGSLTPAAWDEIAAAVDDSDLDYLLEEIPRAIDQSLEGIARVAGIVRAMKEFSHPSTEKTPTDLNAAIQSTATVATNEWKYVAELEMELAPGLPMVEVVPGEFNQVVLNLIVNAAHAIGDVQVEGDETKGTITVRTMEEEGGVSITVSDTGCGMSPEIAEQVFDPFFTTKEVGRGTGQGLSLAHNVVVTKHGGSIGVASAPGEGSTFRIWLPTDIADVAGGLPGSGAAA